MQVGALGFVPISQEISERNAGQVSEEFGSIFSALIQHGKSNPENRKIDNLGEALVGENLPILKEELEQLIQLLSLSEESDWVNLVVNPQSINLNEDLSMLVVENVKMLVLPSIISSLLKNVNPEKNSLDSTLILEKIENFETHLSEMSQEEAIASFLQILSLVKIDQIDMPIDHNSIEQMKTLKMIEWVATKDSANNHSQLTEFIRKFTDKLQGLVKEMNQTNQKEYLSQVFTPFTKEVKERSQVLFQAKPGIFMNDTLLLDQKHGNSSFSKNQNHIQLNGESLSFQSQFLKQDGITLLQGQSSKPVATEQLIQQFESILSKGQFMNRGGNQKLFIKLYPEHLGALRVELLQKDSIITARILTSTSTAKELLESQLQSLKQAFSSQNIQVERIDISNGAHFQDRLINKNPQQQQQEQQQNQQKQQQDENDPSFEHSFSEALLNVEV